MSANEGRARHPGPFDTAPGPAHSTGLYSLAFPDALSRPVNLRLVLMAPEELAAPAAAVVLNSSWSSLDA
jgi:hypothetical protein